MDPENQNFEKMKKTWFPPPPKIRGVLVFEILTKRGVMKKLLRDRGG